MTDILILIIIPLIIAGVIAECRIKKSNKVAMSNKSDDKIKKISERPRVIKDTNHKLSHMNNLMIPENQENFNKDMTNFLKVSLRK